MPAACILVSLQDTVLLTTDFIDTMLSVSLRSSQLRSSCHLGFSLNCISSKGHLAGSPQVAYHTLSFILLGLL